MARTTTTRTRTLHVEKHFTSGNFVRDVVRLAQKYLESHKEEAD